MASAELIRHTPKKTDSALHGTGVEAPPDHSQTFKIYDYCDRFLVTHPSGLVIPETTAADRNKFTGEVIYLYFNAMSELYGFYPKLTVRKPIVDELLGSSSIDPHTDKALNLSPLLMSQMMQEAIGEQVGVSAEHIPLQRWIRYGFFNPQAENPDDPGISVAEIAWRIGTYFEKRLDQMKEGGEVNWIGVSHSADIEPWLYMTLAMEKGEDIHDQDLPLRYFHETGGALEPLTGVTLTYNPEQSKFILTHFTGDIPVFPRAQKPTTKTIIGEDIFREQARMFREYGRSQEILEKKLAIRYVA